MTRIHIHSPSGYYLAQVRLSGHRLWQTIPGKFKNQQRAMCRAIMAMGYRHKRARVLFCADWYEPLVVMEASR